MALLDEIRIMGSGLNRDVRSAVARATISSTLTEVTQLEVVFTDKRWSILGSGLIAPGMRVELNDYNLEISAVSTGNDLDVENFTIKCRPWIVRSLRNRRGTKVMKKVSPSEFIISECKAVGAKYVVQSSARRNQVARDVPKKGDQEVNNPPSSWTTFGRLADELGYIVFESCGTVYFGKPSWLMQYNGMSGFGITHLSSESYEGRAMSVPECSRSQDSPATTVNTTIKTKGSPFAIRPGRRFTLNGVPTFNGDYMVSSIRINLLDPAERVDIEGATPLNPEPNPPQTGKTTTQTRLGTKLSSDFVYWVQKQIGDRYVVGISVNTGITNPSAFDGAELVHWGAAQVGAYMPRGANNQISYCKNSGTEISVASGIRTRGAILWRNNYMGISLGNGQVIEQVNGRVGVVKSGAEKRYTRAGKIPGILY